MTKKSLLCGVVFPLMSLAMLAQPVSARLLEQAIGAEQKDAAASGLLILAQAQLEEDGVILVPERADENQAEPEPEPRPEPEPEPQPEPEPVIEEPPPPPPPPEPEPVIEEPPPPPPPPAPEPVIEEPPPPPPPAPEPVIEEPPPPPAPETAPVPREAPAAPEPAPEAVPVPQEQPAGQEPAPVPQDKPQEVPAPQAPTPDTAPVPTPAPTDQGEGEAKPLPPADTPAVPPAEPVPAPPPAATTPEGQPAPTGEAPPAEDAAVIITPQIEEAKPFTQEELKEAQQIAEDPSKTTDMIVLPVDKGAAVLDSDKEADLSGDAKIRQERQAERAQVENLPPPTSDADAQAPVAAAPVAPPAPITEVKGERLTERPQFQQPEGVTVWRPDGTQTNNTVINETNNTTTNNTTNNNTTNNNTTSNNTTTNNNTTNNTTTNNTTNNTVNNSNVNNSVNNSTTIVQQNVVQQTVYQDNRTIVQYGDRVVVNSYDTGRIARVGEAPYYERLPRGRIRETVVRPDDGMVVTLRNRYGDVIQRSRIDNRGREYVLFYSPQLDREDDERYVYRDPGLDLPPMRLTIPVYDYIIDTTSNPNRDYYDFLDRPPVERVERIYSIEEVRHSARIRDKVRRIDLDTITFATGSADISMKEARTLRKVADAIAKILEKNPAETFLIEGHTDAIGSDQANLILSDRRAESVANILTDVYGIAPENLVTQGYGERYLKVKTLAAEQQNRRVTIRRVTPLVRPVGKR